MQAVPVGKISEAKVCRKAEGNLKNFNLSKNIECKEIQGKWKIRRFSYIPYISSKAGGVKVPVLDAAWPLIGQHISKIPKYIFVIG